MPTIIDTYKGYRIESDGGHGFYKVANPRGESIGTCEGITAAYDMVDDHIEKVYRFWNLHCVLFPEELKAAHEMHQARREEALAKQAQPKSEQGYSFIDQAEMALDRGQVQVAVRWIIDHLQTSA